MCIFTPRLSAAPVGRLLVAVLFVGDAPTVMLLSLSLSLSLSLFVYGVLAAAAAAAAAAAVVIRVIVITEGTFLRTLGL